ncbi:MAG TPA: AMP-binding protein [Verrucomicrobiae bacterium]|jgi:phenylacetate-CoA ligase
MTGDKALADFQLARLRQLLGAILPGNAFYRKKLAGIDPAIASLEDFSARFPFTTKTELTEDQLTHPPFGSNLTFAPVQYTRYHQTSGTTCTPLRWLDTPESWNWMVQSWREIYRAAGVGGGDRVYFAFSFGPFIGFWLAFDAAQQMNCLCIPGGGLSTHGRLRAILENRATALCCTPSYAAHLAEAAGREQIHLAAGAVRTIIVAGEPGGSVPATRRRLEGLWPGARIFDHHGMTETGPVSHECPGKGGALHILDRAYLAEIIDTDGKPARAGEMGELVLTVLGRTGSPLLRYRTGDLARAGFACPCGWQGTALPGGLLGRADEMVVVRGVNVYPAAVEDVLRGFAEIAEYQVEVDRSRDLVELSLRIEPAAGCEAEALAGRVQRALHGTFNLRVAVALAPAGSLPRFEMKARRWKYV